MTGRGTINRVGEAFRLLVCGGRDYADADHVWQTLDRIHAKRPITVLIHGAAQGADSLAATWGEICKVEVQAFPANWAEYGKAAGAIRNGKMLEHGRPDGVVAFPGGVGTADMIAKAEAVGIKVMRVKPRDANDDELLRLAEGVLGGSVRRMGAG